MIFLGYSIVWSLILNFAIFFALTAIIIRVLGLVKHGGIKGLLTARRFMAAMTVHFGLVVISFGITMSSFYQYHYTFMVSAEDIAQGKVFTLPADLAFDKNGNVIPDEYPVKKPIQYSFKFFDYQNIKEYNYMAVYAPIEIYKDGKLFSKAFPEIRQYSGSRKEQSFGEVAYISTISGDLYFILYSFNEDGSMRIPFIYQPFVGWIWLGCIIMALGAFIGATVNRLKDDDSSNKKSFIEA